MIEIRPFRALHYDQRAVVLSDVIAPPYDVIDDAERDRLYASSPNNVVRLILSREVDRYAAAARDLAAWREMGILVRDDRPAFYYYVQDFVMPDGGTRQRAGLLTALRLEPFAAGNIMPHERTFPSHKADRMKIMEACRTNLSPIFALYPGRADSLATARRIADAEPAWLDAVDDKGGRHRVWRVSDPGAIAALRDVLESKKAFIADGHHRYETALEYRDKCRAGAPTSDTAPYDYLLTFLCPMQEPGLVILPTHRVWRGAASGTSEWLATLESEFEVSAAGRGDAGRQLVDRLAMESNHDVIGLRLAKDDASYVLRLRDAARLDAVLADVDPHVRHLDVSLLDGFLLDHVLSLDAIRAAQDGTLSFTHDQDLANGQVSRGEASAAFLLRNPRIEEIEEVCLSGQTMPQKSTYFHPKLQTGLVFRTLDANE
jgi:uncharacterized protein (DUF1015 family)